MLEKKLLKVSVAGLLFFALLAIIMLSREKQATEPAALLYADTPGLILDAGHGGLDGGAVSADGCRESEINLAIVLKMRDLARMFGCDPILTRSSEELDYPPEAATVREKKVWDQKSRAEKINSTENPVLISVHQNMYPDPRPSGPEVYYSKADGAETLAEITQSALVQQFAPECRRLAAPISVSIYLLNHIQCPAILAECGFLSNPEESKKLQSDAYRTELAIILLSSYFRYISESCGGSHER